jgi:entry exclusion lipoprotein TrbK
MIRTILTVATAILLNGCGSDTNQKNPTASASNGSESKMSTPTSMATTAVDRQKILDECAREFPQETQAKEFENCSKNVPFDGDLIIPSGG